MEKLFVDVVIELLLIVIEGVTVRGQCFDILDIETSETIKSWSEI